jgi:hypothetical protein
MLAVECTIQLDGGAWQSKALLSFEDRNLQSMLVEFGVWGVIFNQLSVGCLLSWSWRSW